MLMEQGARGDGLKGPRGQSERSVLLAELKSELTRDLPDAVMLSRRYFRRAAKAVFAEKKRGFDVAELESFSVSPAQGRALPALRAARSQSDAPCVYVLVEPTVDELRSRSRVYLARRSWRLAFYALLTAELRRQVDAGMLPNDAVWDTINRIGQTQFDEIRAAIQHMGRVAQPDDDRAIYCEFIATYLELRHFDPDGFLATFPHQSDHPHIAGIVLGQVDEADILNACRPALCAGMPPSAEKTTAPVMPQRAPLSPVSERTASNLRAIAGTFRDKGNAARTAILYATAARVSDGDRRSAEADLDRARLAVETLAERLLQAIPSADTDVDVVTQSLISLLSHCEKQRFNVEARVLYDLEKVCIAHEETLHQLAPIDWIRSRGQRSLVQELGKQRRVQMLRRLRGAMKRIAKTRLSRLDAQSLLLQLGHLEVHCERALRDDFRSVISAALEAAEMVPSNRAESIEWAKLTEELLDRICNRGFINIGDLRDVIAQNDLKLPDVTAKALLSGDKLLRADRRLADALPGVYRRGEVYMRGLQKLSSLSFGTALGRLLTLYLVLPFGGAFVLLEGLEHSIMVAVNKFTSSPASIVSWPAIGALGLLIGFMIHSRRVLNVVVRAAQSAWRALRFIVVDGPVRFMRQDWVRRLTAHTVYRFSIQFVVKPSLATAITWTVIRVFPLFGLSADIILSSLFICTNIILNSGPWRWFEEGVSELMFRSWRAVRFHVIPGVFELVMQAFNRMIEYMERAIYTVDEWLRLRSGDSRLTFGLKLALNIPWFICTYLIRIYINLLVEPQVNPIKHFPVVTVSHKIILPLTKTLITLFATPLVPVFGVVIGNAIATATVVLLPGVFGFLVWEFKSNWNLYAANQGGGFKTEIIGDHSETMLRFMKPGFHSGTLPSLYGKLRLAQHKGQGHKTVKFEEGLHHVEAAIERFTTRFLIKTLSMAPTPALWKTHVRHIGLSSHRITVEIGRKAGERPFEIAFEEKSGWLVVGTLQSGWVSTLDDKSLGWLLAALTGYYKLAGVEIVREQLESVLGIEETYDIRSGHVVAWSEQTKQLESIYDLGQARAQLRGLGRPDPMAMSLFFGAQRLMWDAWVGFWKQPQPGPPLVEHTLIPAA
ncbi:MAG: hypothetical protein ACON3Z_19330 [Bradymonadia bacterium]